MNDLIFGGLTVAVLKASGRVAMNQERVIMLNIYSERQFKSLLTMN